MKKIILIIALIATAPLISFVRISATPDTGTIAANCRSVQSILSQLSKVDVGTRLNRAADYDRLLSLMFNMNARLSSNRIAAPELHSITAEFEEKVAEFRQNYDRYDNALKDSINIRCVENPREFYNLLERARRARKILHGNVIELERLADYYMSTLLDMIDERGI